MAAFIDFRRPWSRWPIVTRLIVVNVALFLVIRLGTLICFFAGTDSLPWLHVWSMPADMAVLARHWWTPLIYMVAHYDVLHILFNMLWLYWMGDIFVRFYTGRRLMALYIFGGLAGAAVFALGMNFIPALSPTGAWLMGASASVMAIVVATAVLIPDLEINLLFIGGVRLKWIAIVTVVLFVIGLEGTNVGGNLAHLGGVMMGLVYGLCLRRGRDLAKGFNHMLDHVANLFSRPRRTKRPRTRIYNYQPNYDPQTEKTKARPEGKPSTGSPSSKRSMTATDQAQLDAILDKVKRTGYAGLTELEKKILFDVSNRIK